MPADPYNRGKTEPSELDEDYVAYDEVGGAGAAIDDDALEGREHLGEYDEFEEEEEPYAQAAAGGYESDLAVGDPFGDVGGETSSSLYLDREPDPDVWRSIQRAANGNSTSMEDVPFDPSTMLRAGPSTVLRAGCAQDRGVDGLRSHILDPQPYTFQ